MPLESMIGAAAAFCTTASSVPQLQKIRTTGETRDLSRKMLQIPATGLVLWIIYGLLRRDVVVIAANVGGLTLLSCIIHVTLGQRRAKDEAGRKDRAT